MTDGAILSFARTLLSWERVESAKTIARGWVAMHTNDERGWSLLRDAESDPVRAFEFAKQAVRCAPDDPFAALEFGRLASETGDRTTARSTIARYVDHDDAKVRLRAQALARAFS